ncbi:MAG: nickel pincer cofactor biosynthesis protein LarB [Xanthobacteraceae bacterium]
MPETPDFEMDWDRETRTGVSEAVLCGHKSPAQIAAIATTAQGAGRRLLLTRLAPDAFAALSAGTSALLDYDPASGTAVLGGPLAASPIPGIGIVAAGTSDMPVVLEAARSLTFHGYAAPIIADVGVAGLWRLMRRIEDIRRFDVVIAVAGMEGALFSVLAGLLEAPVVAVPTSVGYGVSLGGRSALHAALASCAPGLVVVNIDNGFGAASAAIKMLRIGRRP